MKKQNPINIYVKRLTNGKLSLCEYIRARRSKICEIKENATEEIARWKARFAEVGRGINFVAYRGNVEAMEAAKRIFA